MINTTVGQYLIKKKLGDGAMGSVYLALDTLLDRPVALKLILSDFNDHPEMASRFLAEAKVLASLNRPNIPVLYGYFISSGRGVMAMEYINGETLREMIARRGPIPADIAVPLIKQALQGLAAAHRIGVVHRDLKPSNIMVDQEGTVKVVDFGIAKKIAVEAGLTGTHTTLGTPWYMAPEQVMGRPVTARTDIYSMGVVLYEMLAGQVPFDADSIFKIQTAHVEQIPKPPTVHYPHIPKQLVDIVMKALQKEPEARFASAEELIRALPDLQPPVIQEQTSGPVVAIPEPSRGSGPVSGPSTNIPSTRAETPTPLDRTVKTSSVSTTIDTPKVTATGNRKLLIAGVACVALLAGTGIAWFMLSSTPVEHSAGPVSMAPSPKQPGRPMDILPSGDDTADVPPVAPPKPVRTPRAAPPANPPSASAAASVPVPPTRQTPQPGQELSGVWHGAYTDATSSDNSTRVLVKLQEQSGARVDGTLSFIKNDHTIGNCSLQGSTYSPETKQLKLLTHCVGASPGYFNVPTTFSGVDPTERSLSGKSLLPAVTIALQR
jgi:serine/threonine protein kinase